MNAGEFLNAVRAFPLISVGELTGGYPFVVLAPHPDDESLGAGGLIAAACSAKQHVDVVILTDGAGSHPNSKVYPSDRLVDLRKMEVEKAANALGLHLDRITYLNFQDTKAPVTGPAFEAAASALSALIDTSGAKSMFVTWDGDPHCDHQSAAHLAKTVQAQKPSLALWLYPVWGWHLDPSTAGAFSAPRGFRIDISRWCAVKQTAIHAHKSQMTDLIDDDPDGFRFNDLTLAPFLQKFEYFIEHRNDPEN